MKQVIVTVILGLAACLSTQAKDWYETAAFYQIYPQSFFDGGGGKNGTGSLKGIEMKLDYIKDLGIDCLWLTPIFKSSFNAFGYDITDYEDIDARYGSKEDFVKLIKAVHDKGMKIIVDFVPNHCGEAHPFFQKSKNKEAGYEDYFIWTDKIGNTNLRTPSNWQRIGGPPGSAWNKVEGTNDFYYAQFHRNMPDFNLRNEKVLEYLKSVMKFWLDLNIDGFRIDAISHGIEVKPNSEGFYPDEPETNVTGMKPDDFGYLEHKYTQDQPELFDIIYDWRKFLNEYQDKAKSEAKIIMTESYSPPAIIKKYYQSDDGTKNGAHLPFNFQMIDVIKSDSKASDFVTMVTEWFKVVPKGKVTNWVIGNHDQSRAASRFGEQRVDILNTLVTMLPGTSVTYYGEEIGMVDQCASFTHGHEEPAEKCDATTSRFESDWARSPMQWDETENAGFSPHNETWIPVNDNHLTLNVKAQSGKALSHLEIHKSLLKLRKNKAIQESDKFEIKALSQFSFAFKRELNDKKQKSIVVFVNFSNATESVNIKETLSDMPDSITVEITGGSSAFKKGDNINITEAFDLKQFESIVAFYTPTSSSASLGVSKFALLLLIAVCAFKIWKI